MDNNVQQNNFNQFNQCNNIPQAQYSQPMNKSVNQQNNQCNIYAGNYLLKVYSDDQWVARENWYTEQVQRIVIPPQPNSVELQRIENQIDLILNQALIDNASMLRERDKYKTEKDLSEKETFVIQKTAALKPMPNAPAPKVTEKEIQGMTVAFLRQRKIFNGLDIYSILSCYEYRYAFTSAIVKLLDSKRGALSTLVGAMKVEASIGSGVTSKVQNYNQGNQNNLTYNTPNRGGR